MAGEVVEVGPGNDTVCASDRVYVHYDYSCGRCKACLEGEDSLCPSYGLMGVDHDGGYAELVVAPVRNLFALGENTRFEDAAAAGSVYSRPTTCSSPAPGCERERRSWSAPRGPASAFGAAIQLAKWAGARVIATAGGPAKCERALASGADNAVDYSTPGWRSWVRS